MKNFYFHITIIQSKITQSKDLKNCQNKTCQKYKNQAPYLYVTYPKIESSLIFKK